MYGDGSDTPVHFSGDKLQNREVLVNAGKELPLPQAINQTKATLGGKVFE